MADPTVRALLRKVSIFADVDDVALDNLASLAVSKEYPKGSQVFGQGEPGDAMYIILSGRVRVVLYGENGKDITLSFFNEGDFFGEMALLENLPRTATVIAREVTHLLVLNIGSFLIKLKRDPTFAFNLMQKMSKRIRILNKKILKLSNMDKGDFSGIEFTIEKSEFLKAKDF